MSKNQFVVMLRAIVKTITPEHLTTDDRLEIIELLRRCLAADAETSGGGLVIPGPQSSDAAVHSIVRR